MLGYLIRYLASHLDQATILRWIRVIEYVYGSAYSICSAPSGKVAIVWQVAGGQGTIALEILAEIPFCDQLTLFVPVGGGGLISGAKDLLSHPDCRSLLENPRRVLPCLM